jgi:hypothetical protein
MKSSEKKIKKSAVKTLSRFPAIKSNGGKNILLESPLQSKFCLHLEFDSEVSSYFYRPTFVIENDDKHSFIPDFEVHYTNGDICLFDVRTLKSTQSSIFQQRLIQIESTIAGSIYVFKVLNEREIDDQPLISNYKKLYQYRKRPTLNMATLHECAATVKNPIHLNFLLTKLGDKASLREVYTWLALGYLKFEIQSEHLTTSSQVKFHVD